MTLDECMERIGPFLERLFEPRYDKYETNDYINTSSDCKNALKAYQEWKYGSKLRMVKEKKKLNNDNNTSIKKIE